MTKPYENIEQLNEDKEAQTEQVIDRRQAQRERDEYSWRCGYDYMHEGALGDF
jgi:hypothetical protein